MLLEAARLLLLPLLSGQCSCTFGQDAIIRQGLMAKSNTVFRNCWFLWSLVILWRRSSVLILMRLTSPSIFYWCILI